MISRTMITTIITLFLLMISPSIFAQNTEIHDPVTIKVPSPKKFRSDFDSFILEKSYLPLETNPDCLMPGHNGGIHFYKNLIIISFGQEGIFIFTDKGKFVRRFNLLGPGPEEYKSLHALSIYNDEIFILDHRGGKILVIDINGNFLRTIKTPMYPYDMIRNKGGKLLLHLDKKPFQNRPTEIIEYDEINKNFLGYLPADNYGLIGSNFGVFSKNYSGSFMVKTASDTIYNIDGSSAYPAFILDFGKLSLPVEKRNDMGIMRMMGDKDPFLSLRYGWKQIGQMISFVYSSENNWANLVFYDMKTNSFYGGKWEYPDLEFGRIYAPNQGSTKDSFVFLVQAISIIEDAEKYKAKRSKKYLDLASSLDIEDNPVIVFWKVK